MKKIHKFHYMLTVVFLLFVGLSFYFDWELGKEAGKTFGDNILDFIKILPCTFILIGLFETWVKRETVEKHLGEEAGWKSYLWVCLLGGMTIGPMLTALPVATTLYKKGAALSVILTYLGASAVCRIPMTIFEVSCLGVQFTLVRYLTALPLIVISSLVLSKYLKNKIVLNDKE
ncbi:MAG: permease [Spirochaetales bacterium]|nr:permease [Spirochaetales bacterium]